MFVHPLLNGVNIFAQGNTTEAGLRQKLRTDALPVLFEETEQNEDKDRMRIQHVLSLIRQASTESHARTYKGTVGGHSMEFLIRSMFCLASIQVGIKHQADVERVTVLSLRPKKERETGPVSEWSTIKEKLYSVIERDPTIGARLIRRSMNLLPTIQQNVEVFTVVASKIFGSARAGDQYGTLLAGAWSLFNSQVAPPEQARVMIESYNWDEHRDAADTDESDQALAVLMGSRIRAPHGLEFTVHELVCCASEVQLIGIELPRIDAATFLQRYGMRVKDGFLLLSNASHELRTLMKDTNFAADWRGVLLRIPGTDRNDNLAVKFNGVLAKCIRIPLEPVLRTVEPMTQESFQRSWIEESIPPNERHHD
jgi:putative DNA primase/helicase